MLPPRDFSGLQTFRHTELWVSCNWFRSVRIRLYCDHDRARSARPLTTGFCKQISASLLYVVVNCYARRCAFKRMLTACNADCISCVDSDVVISLCIPDSFTTMPSGRLRIAVAYLVNIRNNCIAWVRVGEAHALQD